MEVYIWRVSAIMTPLQFRNRRETLWSTVAVLCVFLLQRYFFYTEQIWFAYLQNLHGIVVAFYYISGNFLEARNLALSFYRWRPGIDFGRNGG